MLPLIAIPEVVSHYAHELAFFLGYFIRFQPFLYLFISNAKVEFPKKNNRFFFLDDCYHPLYFIIFTANTDSDFLFQLITSPFPNRIF